MLKNWFKTSYAPSSCFQDCGLWQVGWRKACVRAAALHCKRRWGNIWTRTYLQRFHSWILSTVKKKVKWLMSYIRRLLHIGEDFHGINQTLLDQNIFYYRSVKIATHKSTLLWKFKMPGFAKFLSVVHAALLFILRSWFMHFGSTSS